MPFAALLFGALLLPEPKKYDLLWRPQVGQTLEYRCTLGGKIDDEDVDVSATLHVDVRGVTELHGVSTLVSLTDRQDDGESQEDIKDQWVESYSDDEDEEALEDFSTTISILTAQFADEEVAVGQEWTQVVDGDTQYYKLVGVESVNGVEALKVTMHSENKESKGEDTYWFRVSDSTLLKATEHISGKATHEGESYSYDETYTISFVSEKKRAATPTPSETQLLGRVGLQLRSLEKLTAGPQTEVANYDPAYHEYKAYRIVVLTPKTGVAGMATGITVVCTINKDGRYVSATLTEKP